MDYQGNSKKGKEKAIKPDKVVEKVVVGEVIVRKKSLGAKFKGLFFGGDAKDVVIFVADTVLLPALRNLFVDAVSESARRMAFGEDRSRGRRESIIHPPRVSYQHPISRSAPRDPRDQYGANLPDQRRLSGRSRAVNQIVMTTRADAERVLEDLVEIINKYDLASLADYYDLVGLETEPTDYKWGWTFLTGVDIRQERDGYLIDLPPVDTI